MSEALGPLAELGATILAGGLAEAGLRHLLCFVGGVCLCALLCVLGYVGVAASVARVGGVTGAGVLLSSVGARVGGVRYQRFVSLGRLSSSQLQHCASVL